VTHRSDHQKAYDYFDGKAGRLDILINNAAVYLESGPGRGKVSTLPENILCDTLESNFFAPVAIHKSFGMTALVLIFLRIICRLIAGEPPYRNPPGALTHLAARLAHLGLYALMLFMPLTGYIFAATGNHSLPWFGLFF
jgi:hypothetical protein